MPRQDVPYGGAICRLKERIAEIWDKLDQKLHSINGVEGDGAGNVEIVSGDAAVVINNDQIGHRIEVSLDNSKLPDAAVSSVNDQTGAVRLDAKDILSYGDSNVQSDIDENKAAINVLSGDIASEQTARQAADSTLQTNINEVSASIPEMSITPDPYKGVERDAQGRAFAADPESGATDKTLVTANWVSQTGNGAPNNLIHKNSDETKYGKLTLGDILTLYNENWETAPTTIYKWPFDSTTPPTKYAAINGGFVIKDVNNREIWKVRAYRDTNGRDVLSIDGVAYDNTSGYFHFEMGPNGYRRITTDSEMEAADPAAGATDKTLVTANWVSQTGDGAPNNLVHKDSNETIDGIKTWVKTQILGPSVGELRRYSIQPDVITIPDANQDTSFLAIRAANNTTLASETYRIKPDGSASYRIFVRAVGPETVGQFSILEITAKPDGTGELKFIQPNGTSTKLV